jgi:RNAse (barnase) inhibitor barstar
MTILPSAFFFGASRLDIDPAKDLIARIPAGLTDRAELFEALRKELHFPPYFGNNWDALSDCLRDFSWVEKNRIVIMHDDLPHLGTGQLRTYLEICYDSILDWKPWEKYRLLVVFPEEALDAVNEISKS